MARQLLTTGHAARLCSVRRDTVLKWIKKGRLTAARTAGGHFRIDERDLRPMLSQPEREEEEDFQAPEGRAARAPLRCWEYMNRELREECKSCVAYRAHASWCFELVRMVRGAGHAKCFCTGACQDCPYYRRVQGLPANVLLVTRDERLIQAVAKSANGCMAIRYARCGYDASAIISVFRPAFAIVDHCLIEGGEAGLLEALGADPRTPGVRIFLGVRRGSVSRVAPPPSIAGTIELPFTSDDLLGWLERHPVELLSLPEKQARRAS
jgi:excisionase family DNA binding protein